MCPQAVVGLGVGRPPPLWGALRPLASYFQQADREAPGPEAAALTQSRASQALGPNPLSPPTPPKSPSVPLS